jgi:hypothetical protein
VRDRQNLPDLHGPNGNRLRGSGAEGVRLPGLPLECFRAHRRVGGGPTERPLALSTPSSDSTDNLLFYGLALLPHGRV